MDPLNIQINTEHGPVSPFLHRLNNICVSTLGLTLVIYVFFLVLYRTPDYMKSYSRMMLLCGMADAYLLIVDIWCQSRVKINSAIIMMSFEGPVSFLTPEFQCFSMSFQTSSATLACSVLPAQYFYRHCMVKNKTAPTIQQTMLFFAISLAFALITGLIAIPAFCSTKTKCGDQQIDETMLWYSEYPMPNIISGKLCDPIMLIYILYSSTLVVGSYILTLILGKMTIKTLKEQSKNMSHRTVELQAQFAKILKIQTILPLLITVFPMTLIISLTISNMDTGKTADYIMMTITWIPVFNAAIGIACIRPYRRHALGLFRCCFSSSSLYNSLIRRKSSMPVTRFQIPSSPADTEAS